jgi:hypothetical protein
MRNDAGHIAAAHDGHVAEGVARHRRVDHDAGSGRNRSIINGISRGEGGGKGMRPDRKQHPGGGRVDEGPRNRGRSVQLIRRAQWRGGCDGRRRRPGHCRGHLVYRQRYRRGRDGVVDGVGRGKRQHQRVCARREDCPGDRAVRIGPGQRRNPGSRGHCVQLRGRKRGAIADRRGRRPGEGSSHRRGFGLGAAATAAGHRR